MASPDRANEFDGLVVMITGAASGIGFATARGFSQQGAQLSLADFNGDNLKIAAEECQKLSPKRLLPYCSIGDLTDPQNRVKFRDSTLQNYGRIDILINCAGRALLDSGANMDVNVFEKIMDVNLKLAYHLTELCVPHLVETKGNIVNVSSVASSNTRANNLLSYSMSKAALDMLTKHLAGDLGPKGVRVNSVNPGFTYTNIGGQLDREKHKKTHGPKSVFNRCAEPQEIADAILFLASKKSSFTTGTLFLIDGGNTSLRIAY